VRRKRDRNGEWSISLNGFARRKRGITGDESCRRNGTFALHGKKGHGFRLHRKNAPSYQKKTGGKDNYVSPVTVMQGERKEKTATRAGVK